MELNLRYEFSSREIPITDAKKREGERMNANVRLSDEKLYDERTNIVLCLPGGALANRKFKKIPRLHFFN